MQAGAKVFAGAITASWLLLFGAPSSQAEEYPIWWSPILELESLDKIDERLARELWPDGEPMKVYKYVGEPEAVRHIEDDVTDCNSLLRLSGVGYTAWGSHDRHVQFILVAACDALDRLKDAAPAKESYLKDFVLDRDALGYLPAMLYIPASCDFMCRRYFCHKKPFPPSLGEAEDYVSVELVRNHTMELRDELGLVRFQILARADFNGDELEDILVRSESYSLEGSWGAIELYLLTREAPDGVLRVLEAERHLCPDYRCDPFYTCPESSCAR